MSRLTDAEGVHTTEQIFIDLTFLCKREGFFRWAEINWSEMCNDCILKQQLLFVFLSGSIEQQYIQVSAPAAM